MTYVTKVNLTLEKRLIDIMKRKGIHENTVYHINVAQKLKEDFDKMLGYNLYDLFPNVIKINKKEKKLFLLLFSRININYWQIIII